MGFLGYTKLNKSFVKYCESISDIDNIKYTIVGDTYYGKELLKDVSNSFLIRDKTEFIGYVDDIRHYLSELDILLYPLNPMHYGSTENVLIEAMAMGVVPIVLNQCAEKYLISHLETGILINNINECRYYVNRLYNNNIELEKISKRTSEFAISNYNIKSTINKLNKVYTDLMYKDKICHNAEVVFGKNPYEWFRSCYFGDLNNLKGCAISETKGSVKHYFKYFKDYRLRKVIELNESRE